MTTGTDRNAAAAALRRRNLRTGWILGGVALALALSIWYSKIA